MEIQHLCGGIVTDANPDLTARGSAGVRRILEYATQEPAFILAAVQPDGEYVRVQSSNAQ
jgi:hypothetical protein